MKADGHRLVTVLRTRPGAEGKKKQDENPVHKVQKNNFQIYDLSSRKLDKFR
jgi:hypothetical protein